MSEHTIYTATVKQLTGLLAERDALTAALAAKQDQVDGLLEERAVLRAMLTSARNTLEMWRLAYAQRRDSDDEIDVLFEVSAATDDGAEEEA